jgi:hypothetical protein
VVAAKTQAELYVCILDQYLYYYARDAVRFLFSLSLVFLSLTRPCAQVPLEAVQRAVDLVGEKVTSGTPDAVSAHAESTLAFIRSQQSGDAADARFKLITVPAPAS